MHYNYGTYIRSENLICFTGDFFPFNSPSCKLFLNGVEVNTRLHNANEYQIDDSVVELVVNDGYDEDITQDFNIYQTGEPI